MTLGKRIAICIATAGRPDIVVTLLRQLKAQTRAPDRIIVAMSSLDDIGLDVNELEIELIVAERGLTRQRNALLAAASDIDIVVFFDDDFFPYDSYLAEIEKAYCQDPRIAMTTGRVTLDGIMGPGISSQDAIKEIEVATSDATFNLNKDKPKEIYNSYGCNMSVNAALARQHKVLFDIRLPLYGWQEDVDFSRQMARYGKIVQVSAACGIHLGVKSGRVSGVRFGYSQVINPVYLLLKGTINIRHAGLQVARNILANIFKLPLSEPHVDRAGRLKGNALAIIDLCRGRVMPEQIVNL